MTRTSDWPVYPLKDVADIASGITLGRKTKETELIPTPYLRVANVQDGYLDLRLIKTIEITAGEMKKWTLQYGDLLLTEGGDPDKLGRGWVWRNELPVCIHQNHIFRVRLPAARFDPDFVSAQIGSPYGKAYFLARGKQTTGIATINRTVLGAFPLMSPAIDEQRRIAERLRTTLRAVEEARIAAKNQHDEIQALGDALIRRSITEKAALTRCGLGDVLTEVKAGIGSDWANYPVLGATRDGLAPAKEPVGKAPERYKPVTPGTLFYNPMRILIGSIAMVDQDDAPGITSPDYVVLRGKAGVVDTRWFYYWLRSPLGAACIASLARGAVRERMLFNRLAEGSIDLPPYAVQSRTSEALATLRPLRTQAIARAKELERLPALLLDRAFSS